MARAGRMSAYGRLVRISRRSKDPAEKNNSLSSQAAFRLRRVELERSRNAGDRDARVLVESRDGTGERWYTIGVSPNIIDASFEALYESITYKLMKTGAA